MLSRQRIQDRLVISFRQEGHDFDLYRFFLNRGYPINTGFTEDMTAWVSNVAVNDDFHANGACQLVDNMVS